MLTGPASKMHISTGSAAVLCKAGASAEIPRTTCFYRASVTCDPRCAGQRCVPEPVPLGLSGASSELRIDVLPGVAELSG